MALATGELCFLPGELHRSRILSMHMRSCCVVDSGELILTQENSFEHS